MNRKKKLKIIQISLFLVALIIIFSTYLNKNTVNENDLIKITEKSKNILNSEIEEETNLFFNIEYSGIDLSGNRYILKSEKAKSKKESQEIISMEGVVAIFYFKDGTILNIKSKFGIYNNKTLDMKFSQDIVAKYNESILNANSAEYLNSKGTLKISENVKITDKRGKLDADELLFDLKKQTLKVASKQNNYINTKIKLNEKGF